MKAVAEKQDIRRVSKQELEKYLEERKEPSFRARQIYEWLWKKSAFSFEEMTNLSKDLRNNLKEDFSINHIEEETFQESAGGTLKVRFQLHDGNLIEGVLIPTENRVTACISSQVGCSLSCKFCATGFLDLKRNLYPDEIYDQVVLLNRQSQQHYGRALTNIVFMGMGEPLLNYKNVLKAIDLITSENGLGISTKRITVSTAGIAKMIRKLGDDKVKFNLALSLHAATDEKRSEIMAINETNSINSLVESLNHFYSQTKNKITFEYILFQDFNDSIQDAQALVALCKRVPAMVNIIEYNPVDRVPFSKASEQKLSQFVDYLEKHRVNVKVRRSRGKDIDAACGQLANKK